MQVKRQTRSIEAEQIREFAGALLLNGVTTGIYVKTGDYRAGAKRTAGRFGELGIAIDLWDARTFYDCLKIAARDPYQSADDLTAPFAAFWQNPSSIPEVIHDSCGRG